jgi:PAS domain S-box-containing protein
MRVAAGYTLQEETFWQRPETALIAVFRQFEFRIRQLKLTTRMSIRTKLVLSLSIILTFNLAVGLYAFKTYQQTTRSAELVSRWANQIVTTSLVAQIHFKTQVQEWKNVLLRGHEPELYERYLNQFYDEERNTQGALEALLPLLDDDSDIKKATQAFYQAHQKLGSQYREAISSYQQFTSDPHIFVDKLVRGIDREPTDLLDQIVSSTLMVKETRLAELAAEAGKTEKRILLVALGGLTLAVVLLMWFADYAIGKPISAATGIARRISDGNLTGEISVYGRGETAQLLQSLKTMQDNLVEYQNNLRKSVERTRLLLDSSGEGIYGVDTDGHCIFVNPAGVSMLKYNSADDLLGKEIHSLMHHTKADGSFFPFDECPATHTFRTGKVCHVDDEIFWRADGTGIPVEYSSYPIRHAGKLIGAVVLFSDISKRKQADLALAQAHKALQAERTLLARRVEERTAELNLSNAELARSARAKDEFLAAMSHEFRTPLTTIMGTSEMLMDGLYGELVTDAARAVSNIEESAQHLLSIINDILDVAKVEAGKIKLKLEEVSVPQLCEASLRLIRQPAQKKNLEVSSDIDSMVQFIHGDAQRLKQLFVNLLSNAVKFTPEGGSIGMQVKADVASGIAAFTVWDKGIGIPQEDMGKLFKPFVQLESQLTRHHAGTGLGLVLAYRMAELHGGGISVASDPGKGSQFTVTLPWAAELPGTPHSERPREDSDSAVNDLEPGQNATILLAEDHEANSTLLTKVLRSRGYQVFAVKDGVEALAAAREIHPDIILMDIQMPCMDGLKATRQIRADSMIGGIPVIAMTALTMPGDREQCLRAGVNDYLEKPLSIKALLKTIQEQLRHRKHS